MSEESAVREIVQDTKVSELESSDQATSSSSDLMPSDAPSTEGVFTTAFLQRRKKGKFREVEAPAVVSLGAPVADTHAHLQMLQNPAARLARCAVNGVRFVCAMTDPVEDPDCTYSLINCWQEEARSLLTKAGLDQYVSQVPEIRIAIGCHPHNAKYYSEALEEALIRHLHDPRTCALGEVGLDYHYDLSPRDVQRNVFRRQITIAKKAGIPLILHMREAHDEGFQILKEEGIFDAESPTPDVLLHCFNLDSASLKPWADAGCYIAYGGPLTFKKADEVREGALHVSLDKLLTETDSPYMTPEPMRGMECGPEHTVFTAAKMLEVRGCDTEIEQRAFLEHIYHNALSLLNREPTSWQQMR